MFVNDKNIESSRGYEARGIIAKINQIGYYAVGPMLKVPVYQFVTLDCGPGREKIIVEFSGPAPYDKKTQELDLNKVKEGDIVINPGFLYKKRQWTQELMSEHLRQLKNYKPKILVKAEVDRSIPMGNITIDPHNITKQ